MIYIYIHDRDKVCVGICLKRLKEESLIRRDQKRKAVHQQTELARDLKATMWARSFRLLV